MHRFVLYTAGFGACLLAPHAHAQFVLQDHVGNGAAGSILGIDDAELTPDGRFAIARDNTILTSARIYDALTGDELAIVTSANAGSVSGVAQDAVVCTDERAFVMGSSLMVIDLTQASFPLIVEHDLGFRPRDIAITPDGTMVAVRGGSPSSGSLGGLYVFDVQSGAQLVRADGEPDVYSPDGFDVDSVVADDEHAVFTSYELTAEGDRTRVTILDLHPAGGGMPVVVFELSGLDGLIGAPHDLAMTPDGLHAAVRSESEVSLFRLNGAGSDRAWRERLFGSPGNFGGSALDSIEATNERVTTISRWSNGGIGAQVDVFSIDGLQRFDRINGDPHDLAIMPNGDTLVVRTSSGVYLYDLVNLGLDVHIDPLAFASQITTHTSWGAGLDSVACVPGRAVTMARNNFTTNVTVWSVHAGEIEELVTHVLPDRPVDLQITPDATRAIATGLGYIMVIDLRTGEVVIDHQVTIANAWPWCDGVVANDTHAVAFGYLAGNSAGWISVVDLFAQPQSYCSATQNSTGRPASIFAAGAASISSNELVLWASNVPDGQPGLFTYGSMTAAVPFGDGLRCVGGNVFSFASTTAANQLANEVVDFTQLIGPGAILPGSTWNFQYVFRDKIGTRLNLTDGLTIDFGA